MRRAGAENWLHFAARGAESKGDRLARSHVARLALLRVMYENRVDLFVHPRTPCRRPDPGPAGGDQQPGWHHAVLQNPESRGAGGHDQCSA